MTHTISHQYDEIIQASLPGLEIHVVYDCESEIVVDEEGNEETNRLLTISASVDGNLQHLPKFPEEKDGQQTREFLALLRESARQALWAKACRKAQFQGYPPETVNAAAERWMRTGSTKLPINVGKPERDFVE